MKKLLFLVTSLFLVEIIVLLTLVFATETNPFNLSHWIIVAFSGFALSLSSYILIDRSKFATPILLLSLIDFGIIIVLIKSPAIFDLLWNSALVLLIFIMALAVYSLIPKNSSLLNSLTKISVAISFLILIILCVGKLEISGVYQFEFYSLIVSSVLLLLSVLASKSAKTVTK